MFDILKANFIGLCDTGYIDKEGLHELGFMDGDIADLLSLGIIMEKVTDNYEIKDQDALLSKYVLLYCLNSIKGGSGSSSSIRKTIKKCVELWPKSYDVCLMDVYFQILESRPRRVAASQRIEDFKKENGEHDGELNLLLFLIYCLRRDYVSDEEGIITLKSEDLSLGINDSLGEKGIIGYIYSGKFGLALSDIQRLPFISITRRIYLNVVKLLLQDNLKQLKNIPGVVKEMLGEKDYNKLKQYLLNCSLPMEIMHRNRIWRNINLMLEIVQVIIDINETKAIPNPVILDTNDLDDAIHGKNFFLALRLDADNIKKKNISEDNPITLLLQEVTSLIRSIEPSMDISQPFGENVAPETFDVEEMYFLQGLLHDQIELKIAPDYLKVAYGLTHEEIQAICLIQVRDYYIDGEYEKGDELLDKVVNSRDKTSRINNFILHLRNNKLNYKEKFNMHTLKRRRLQAENRKGDKNGE